MEHLLTSESIISFLVLVVLEVVLGIDNVIFVSLILNRLKEENKKESKAGMDDYRHRNQEYPAYGFNLVAFTKGKHIFSISGKGFDLASLVMLAGGLFLIYKAVKEIHGKLEGEDHAGNEGTSNYLTFGKAVAQIMLIDAVFSFDSVITAGGTAKYVEIMIAAVVVAMVVMFLFSPRISSFIHKHPTLKMLALSFLVMIGLSLVIEGWDAEKAEQLHLKNYIYFGMAFSFMVEVLNMTMRKRNSKKKIVHLNEPVLPDKPGVSDAAH